MFIYMGIISEAVSWGKLLCASIKQPKSMRWVLDTCSRKEKMSEIEVDTLGKCVIIPQASSMHTDKLNGNVWADIGSVSLVLP